MERIDFNLSGSFQTEGIEAINETDYYITSETNVLGPATLYRINTDFVVSANDQPSPDIQYFPNPASRSLKIHGIQEPGEISVALINTMGKQLFYHTVVAHTPNEIIKISLMGVPAGAYVMRLSLPRQELSRKLIIE